MEEWTDRQCDLYDTMMLLYMEANVLLPEEKPSSSLGFTRSVCEKLVDGYLEMKPDEVWFALYQDTLRSMTPEDIRRVSVRLEILALQVADMMKNKESD